MTSKSKLVRGLVKVELLQVAQQLARVKKLMCMPGISDWAYQALVDRELKLMARHADLCSILK